MLILILDANVYHRIHDEVDHRVPNYSRLGKLQRKYCSWQCYALQDDDGDNDEDDDEDDDDDDDDDDENYDDAANYDDDADLANCSGSTVVGSAMLCKILMIQRL